MIKRILLFAVAAGFLVLGLVGLLIPVLPGFVFLVMAALCLSAASPGIRRTLRLEAVHARWRRSWDAGEKLPFLQRGQLAFWLSLDAVARTIRRR